MPDTRDVQLAVQLAPVTIERFPVYHNEWEWRVVLHIAIPVAHTYAVPLKRQGKGDFVSNPELPDEWIREAGAEVAVVRGALDTLRGWAVTYDDNPSSLYPWTFQSADKSWLHLKSTGELWDAGCDMEYVDAAECLVRHKMGAAAIAAALEA